MKRSTAVTANPAVKLKKPNSFLSRWNAPIAGYLFISPWLIGFLGLTAYPLLLSLYYSFTDYTLMEPISWVGTRNYEQILTADPKFLQSVKVTFMYVIASVPLKLAAALLVAILLNKAVKGISLYRTAIYFPSLIGEALRCHCFGETCSEWMAFSTKLLRYSALKERVGSRIQIQRLVRLYC